MTEVYVSTDIESDGPIPGPYSMLSFASVAFSAEGTEVSHFTANLELLDSATADPDTMAWWAKQGDAYARTRENVVNPRYAMEDYVTWLRQLPGKPVFVGYPAGFDFTFIRWYLVNFTGVDPFSFAALDMKTLAMALLGGEFRAATKRNFPKHWFPKNLPHTHVALEDAREQGYIFTKMLAELRSLT